MSVLPKPSVMPWTAPKVRLTATMPATMPVATGSIAAASARSEAKASSSKLPITTLPTIASKRTSRSICARLCAANTPGPLASSRNCGEAGVADAAGVAGAVSALSAPKALRARAIAVDCASRSAPAARVVASSSARGAVRATHTPCSLLGMLGAMSDSAMRCVSPVGSRASSGLSALPAGVPSSESVSSMASRRPAAV